MSPARFRCATVLVVMEFGYSELISVYIVNSGGGSIWERFGDRENFVSVLFFTPHKFLFSTTFNESRPSHEANMYLGKNPTVCTAETRSRRVFFHTCTHNLLTYLFTHLPTRKSGRGTYRDTMQKADQ